MSEASIILEEINRSGGNSGACHAQMYTMGTLLRHGSDEQKRRYLPRIASGELRLQAFGVSEPTTGSDTTQLKTMAVRKPDRYVVRGSEGLDLARRTFGSAAARGADDADRAGEEADRRAVDSAGGPARGRRTRTDDPPDPHDDESCDDGAVLRRPRGAARRAGRRRGQRLPVSDRRPQCRAHPDRRGMRRRRPLVHRARHEVRAAIASSSTGRSGRTRACSSRSPARTSTSRPPT